MSYTSIFGTGAIFPADPSLRTIALSANLTLQWPTEVATTTNVAADILEVAPTIAGLSITMPGATKASVGQTIFITNRGAYDFLIINSAASSIANIAVGTAWLVYVADNSTDAGVWRALQFGSTTTLAQASTLAGAGIVASGGLLAQSMPVATLNTNYTIAAADRAKAIVWTGGVGTLTFPAASTLGANWFVNVKNSGTGILTLSASSLIDTVSSISLSPNDGCILCTDGSTFYSFARNSSASSSGFDYLTVSIGGSGDYTLTGTQLNRISYKLSGVLTGDRNLIVPTSLQQYWVNNQTTGAYNITVKTASGTGVVVPQGQAMILYCDGTNVVNAATAGISTPISIANGGTGATTASAARASLGSTSTGDALFTAASATAGRATLDVYATAESVSSDLLYSLVMS